jgi:glyoxylase-like metal-dependent hydrolase (beta-lactamase superfamily II)
VRIHSFTFNAFQENTYVLWDAGGACAIVDPGCYDAAERKELTHFITANGLAVKLLLNTHCHIDHVLGNAFVMDTYRVPLLVHKDEEPVLRSVKAYAPNYGFANYQEALPDRWLSDKELVSFGTTTLSVLHLPGHSPGHVGFYNAPEQVLVAGDVLFRSSIGRTDLPGGDFDTLIASIHRKLFVLPDTVTVYPGHGPETTLGEEKASNPFCALKLFS